MSALANIDRPTLHEVLKRAAEPDEWERFERQLRSNGYCRQPVRLKGQVDSIDTSTGEVLRSYSTEREPDGTLLKCCGNRREAVCPSCARTYRGDAFQLVAAGMRGGKGVPETVAEHPLVFLTLTAPSFGPVHSRRVIDGQARRCRPRRNGGACAQGVSVACNEIHAEDDPRLGEPICPGCFDYEHNVLWNALAPELWRYTSNQLPRELARLLGVKQSELDVRVSYVKVAEFQRRGALHFRCVLRLDGIREDGELEAPAERYGAQLLIDAVTAAVRHVCPLPRRDERPPAELRVRAGARDPLGCAGRDARARHPRRRSSVVRGLHRQVRHQVHRGRRRADVSLDASDVQRLRVRPHVRRLVECAWKLGGHQHLHKLRLRRWAHQLGFRGHCFTKSRRYSTTFTRLRQARHEHVLQRNGQQRDPSSKIRRWAYTGSGYKTFGDAWLAESGRKRAFEQRRIAREELRTGHPVGGRESTRRETVMGISRMAPGEQYVTAREIADRVGLSTDTILRYYRDGKIPGRRMPGQIRPVRFLWSEVEAAFNGIADQAAVDARREWTDRLGGQAA